MNDTDRQIATSPPLAAPFATDHSPASASETRPSPGPPSETRLSPGFPSATRFSSSAPPSVATRPSAAPCLPTRYALLASPVGELLMSVDSQDRLTRLHFPGRTQAIPREWLRDEDALAEPSRQLREYFASERTDFELALAPAGTPFQRQVWEALRAIPYGTTVSYGEIARAVGQPGAARAVGGANNRNPIAIVIPCHRVIGASGSLTGYGGGLERKRTLLALESGRPALL
jgi:methylated-DNA-[protein]-cysteine S-methyltransferase